MEKGSQRMVTNFWHGSSIGGQEQSQYVYIQSIEKRHEVVVEQVFMPSFFFNLPPVSWYIRWLTVKTNKAVAKDFQIRAASNSGGLLKTGLGNICTTT
ncbi:hypothetical protein F2Q70_00040371 [Brassica cretica]|uniref:Uncharacterized protein n=2 Tax=Brassica cretica TaxID=69181 RepID=A0A8S9K3U7_BRACR|nr:hypothetical protein F2Q70_00040371 [Brassica cretica]KAF2616462.1 hypothetical protein F2Q68_00041035 [Brassica cretica]KAF3498204.1 hypothetical protein DY000_02055365 [Brassica cretica]